MKNRASYITNKIVSLHVAEQLCAGWKMKGEKIVFTNGCFDILHHGHVYYLAEAAQLGKRLVIGINSDSSVKKLNKSPERPLNNQLSRAYVLAGLGMVDLVIIFEEDTPLNLINTLLPDVLVKGGDYHENETNDKLSTYIVGSREVKNAGGKVQTIPLKEGFSTTEIIRRMKG